MPADYHPASIADARQLRDALDQQGRKLVFTNGCFDLLHAGHVRYLEQARALGDALVVALNSDQSVRLLKGPDRPLNTQNDRAEVLAALRAVDAVVVFDDERASALIEAIRPHVYAKGGDYTVESLHAGERAALATAGAEIRILPLVPDRSTTGTINKMLGGADACGGRLRIAVLGSGEGSNLRAIIDSIQSDALNAEIAVTISDQAGSNFLQIARAAGLPAQFVDGGQNPRRLDDAAQKEIHEHLERARVDVVVLAGFMRILKDPVISAYKDRIVNVHPSLLPKHKGANAPQLAINAGESESGCTVHLVTADIDGGRVLAQAKVPLQAGDTAESLHARIKIEEHKLLPQVLHEWRDRGLAVRGGGSAMSNFTGTLNHQQREAATHIHGPLLILAGAGTGKTRVLTARISFMVNEGIDPKNILSVTFTNKAATEMRERVKGMVRDGLGKKVVLGTFHAFCARLLREFAAHVGYKNNFVIYSQGEQESLLKRILKSLVVKDETLDASVALSRISKSKNDGKSLGDPQFSLDAAIMQKYQDEMRGLNVMDFDDLLVLGVRLLEDHADVRATVQSRHHYVMVDEFQDTNSLQMRLLRALVPAPYNVCVVGDDDQSIYGWRGAEITNITEFENFFPNPHVVKLEENYRSTTPILHTANSLIKNNAGRRPKSLWSRNNGTDLIRLITTQDEKEEADMIAKEVENARLATNQPFEDFAVLFRTNDQSRVLEQAFRQRKIPYRVVGARSFFDRREVKDVLSYLNVLHNPHDDMSLLRVLNTPTRGIGSATAELARERSMEKGHSIWVALCDEDFLRQIPEKGRNAIRSFTDIISKFSGPAGTRGTQLVQMTEALILEVGYMDYLKKAAKDPEDFAGWENGIREFLKSLAGYEERNRADGLGGFLDEISLNDEREEKDDIEKKKGVCLITMHASKGLEFPVVYLPGVEQGTLPHKRSFDEGRVDEERRLFYVGITRAKQKLTLSHTRTRMKWGQKQTTMPSTFLKELDRKYIEELDYTHHMNETATQEENTNFFSGLRAMLAEQ